MKKKTRPEHQRRILIVDDDNSILEAFKLMLENAGYSIETNTGIGGLKNIFTSKLPDLIILDVLLSGHDGRTICKELKLHEKTKHIPIILMSAHPDVKKTVKDTKADDFIEKPFDMNDLFQRIKKLIH